MGCFGCSPACFSSSDERLRFIYNVTQYSELKSSTNFSLPVPGRSPLFVVFWANSPIQIDSGESRAAAVSMATASTAYSKAQER
ncbi:hypothetical protein Trydic_g18500 [Trypoxylus dichotomus]